MRYLLALVCVACSSSPTESATHPDASLPGQFGQPMLLDAGDAWPCPGLAQQIGCEGPVTRDDAGKLTGCWTEQTTLTVDGSYICTLWCYPDASNEGCAALGGSCIDTSDKCLPPDAG